jgi:hypothetical protein
MYNPRTPTTHDGPQPAHAPLRRLTPTALRLAVGGIVIDQNTQISTTLIPLPPLPPPPPPALPTLPR